MTVHANNFLAAEPDIVQRLKTALAGMVPAVHVLTAAELEGVKESAQLTPALHVIWNGFKVLESTPTGTAARLDHTWLIVTAVKNAAGARNGAAARRDAGELMARAGAALAGYRPPNVAGPMRLAPAPGAGYSPGYMYLPLAFMVESVFKAS